jgi:nitrite reductase/ring-hydroxylating ferredoxin subunit
MAEARRPTAVARADELAPGTACAVRAGDVEVALVRVGDEFFAVQPACPHLQGPLGEGRVEGYVLSCPFHGWQFDVRTGENEFDGAITVETYEVDVDGGDVRVLV